ncbi:MAG TPA: hypothetical protein VHL31_12100 [Geminicoccus sp.]|jgi:hypothetical protein|uniref:cell division protein FtsL n=1 Tax=Geminicoccus sp. TaxID=2024832 RepID=UPI002E2F6F16|nr:hypothetical protein [Geminicoccus sp.]HEX2527022.1 hypothetical protein [Geminicoccus sp.]
MTGRKVLFLVLLLLGTAWGTFHLKYEVVQLENHARALERQIVASVDEIRTLEADLALRTHPDRMVAVAPKLDMVPVYVTSLASVGDMPDHARIAYADRVLAVLLPSGAEVPTRMKPLVLGGIAR